MNFSVLMSIYKNTDLDELVVCMDSIFSQTVQSDDIVIVFDGQVPIDVEEYLDKLTETHSELNLIKCEQNRGLGPALAMGMKNCKNELIARMDSDDVCVPNRFELQLNAFEQFPDCSIIGGNMSEFVGSPDNIVSTRIVPENHNQICEFMKKRCPFNHITVMFKKTEVECAGGYLDWYCNEDYYLWIRMYIAGCRFYNIQQVLSLARVDSMMGRRGGKRYYESERDLFKYMHKHGIISRGQYLKSKAVRFIAYRMLPDSIRQKLYQKYTRSEKNVKN